MVETLMPKEPSRPGGFFKSVRALQVTNKAKGVVSGNSGHVSAGSHVHSATSVGSQQSQVCGSTGITDSKQDSLVKELFQKSVKIQRKYNKLNKGDKGVLDSFFTKFPAIKHDLELKSLIFIPNSPATAKQFEQRMELLDMQLTVSQTVPASVSTNPSPSDLMDVLYEIYNKTLDSPVNESSMSALRLATNKVWSDHLDPEATYVDMPPASGEDEDMYASLFNQLKDTPQIDEERVVTEKVQDLVQTIIDIATQSSSGYPKEMLLKKEGKLGLHQPLVRLKECNQELHKLCLDIEEMGARNGVVTDSLETIYQNGVSAFYLAELHLSSNDQQVKKAKEAFKHLVKVSRVRGGQGKYGPSKEEMFLAKLYPDLQFAVVDTFHQELGVLNPED